MLQSLLPQIESKRTKLEKQRDFLKRVKLKLQEVEQCLTEERAEIAAQTSLLSGDQALREKIAAEEREKFLVRQETVLAEVISEEQDKIREVLQLERAENHHLVTDVIDHFKGVAAEASTKLNEQELKMLRMETDEKFHVREVAKLKKSLETVRQEKAKEEIVAQQVRWTVDVDLALNKRINVALALNEYGLNCKHTSVPVPFSYDIPADAEERGGVYGEGEARTPGAAAASAARRHVPL
jgi:hypothetical protein